MIFAVLSDQAAMSAGHGSHAQALVSGTGWVLHNIGVLLMLRFVVIVYRPDSRWARRLAVVLGVVLWSGWLVFVANGGLYGRQSIGYWVALGGSIWIVNVPLLVRPFVAEVDLPGLTVMSLLVTAVFGLATVSMYWLTFFPPAWYRDRIVAAASASHA